MEWFTLSLHDDGLGEASIELLASAQTPQSAAMEAELQALLAQAQQGAEALGIEWAHDLQRTQEAGWTNLHLTLSGPAAWAEALAAAWDR
jgi:hypothetical protein